MSMAVSAPSRGRGLRGSADGTRRRMSPRSRPVLLFASAALALNSCVSDSLTPPPTPELADPSLRLISATGKQITIGSADSLASPNERPPMKVSFTYDFRMDSVEVTVALYRQVMGRVPAEYASSPALSESEPVCHVSWFDAVLFCNRRSRQAGLDTVYRYSKSESLPSGPVYRLEGLATDFSKRGYRLPTEAEWEFAAHGGGSGAFPWGSGLDQGEAAKFAWFAANSDRRPHPVAQLQPNGFGLYDMAGNAMEWTTEGAAPYGLEALTNYAGGSASLSLERPLKGGSFLHGMAQLRVSNRSDIYPTIASSATAYLGFRCVVAAIPSASVFTPQVTSDTLSPVFVPSAVLPPWVGFCRLVFVNRMNARRTLCFADLGRGRSTVHQFADFDSAQLPAISPNGEMAAFCTGGEGQTGTSSVLVRRLSATHSRVLRLGDAPAFAPHWWVDTAGADTFIVYTTSTVDNASASWAGTQTKMVRFADGAFGPITVLEPAGSFHGGRSADGRYLVTGYTRLRTVDLQTGERRTLFTSPGNGKRDDDTSQVCNVSFSPDRGPEPRAMFLDFGSAAASTLTGTTYGIHEYLFVSGYSGAVLQWLRAPAGFAAWDHPRWSNSARLVVAGVEQRGAHPAIYLVNLSDSTAVPLAQGADLWHPDLWVSDTGQCRAAGLSFDSVGRYFDPPLSTAQGQLAYKLRFFWAMRDSLQIAILGNSQAAFGVDPSLFRGRAYNMAYMFGDPMSVRVLAENYLLNHCAGLQVVIASLHMDALVYPDGDGSWSAGTALSTGYVYDRNHSFWKNGLPTGFVGRVLAVPVPQTTPYLNRVDSLGLFRFSSHGWGAIDTTRADLSWTAGSARFRTNFASLLRVADLLAAKKVHLVLVQFPQHPGFRRSQAFGPAGPSSQTAHQIVDMLRQQEATRPYLHFYDANNFGAHDYAEDEAWDPIHLSEKGARKLGARLDSLVRQFLR